MLTVSDDASVAAVLVHHARRAHRLRLEVPELLGDGALARAIERSAAARPGVERVRASAVTGRILIEYAPGAGVIDELERLARRPARPRPAGAQAAAEWHAEEVGAVCARLATSADDGLAPAEARGRLASVGANTLEEERPPSRLALLAEQVANLPTAMLLGSTVVSIVLGDLVEAGAILTVIGVNAAIGYRVERRSHDLLAAWRAAEVGKVAVIRGGSMRAVPSSELVPGDLLVVRAGDVISADARVVDAHRLTADEAPLTGESEAAAKASAPVHLEAPLAERAAMLYAGTSIASGHGRAIAVATGAATEIARVQRLAAEARAPKGRLRRRLDALSSRLAWAGLSAAGASALASLAHLRDPLQIVRESVALGVAAIPEGLTVTASAALVRAMSRLRARGVIVRRLATAETLGAITVACIDKTGTLTENRMLLEVIAVPDRGRTRRVPAVRVPAAPGPPPLGPLGALLAACVLNSDLEYQRNGHGRLELAGSSTERALVEAAQRAGLDPEALRARWPRGRLTERRDGVHYVISEHPGVAFVKGAPEQVVPLCDLDEAAARAVLAENDALAREGLRVLAVASQPIAEEASFAPGSWRCLGLVALRDPLRAGAAEVVRVAARAGIRALMLTGDQRATAAAIAAQAGLAGDVIEGHELRDLLAAPDAAERLRRIAVIARVTPADKIAVVEALRRHGEVVAMVGDGINDAPALRGADVGIAVGARSADLARQTADVVLERPDVRAVLEAIAEGRAVQDNLRRSIRFQAAGNLGEILVALGAAVAGRSSIPSLGLLWINLLTDTLPGLALALEPHPAGLLDRPPRPPDAPILDRRDWRRVARDGALIAAGSGLAAIAAGPLGAFAAVGATQFGYAVASRAPGRGSTSRFAAMVGGSAALHLIAVASAPARAVLRIGGSAPIALVSFGLGLGAPLYVAWRRAADHQIVRRKGA